MKTQKDFTTRITYRLTSMAPFISFIIFCVIFTNNLFAETLPVRPPGTPNTRFEISTLAQLRWLSEGDGTSDTINTKRRKWHYVLTANIDATDTKYWNIADHDNDDKTPDVAMGFYPIGHYNSTPTRFQGSFDGQGHTISNLYIYRQTMSGDHAGLFGSVETDYFIRNVTVYNIDFTCKYGGALISRLHKGDISNCHTSGQLNASWGGIGGLIGNISYMVDNSSVLITDCSSSCNVTAISVNDNSTSTIGGLIGEATADGSSGEFISIMNCTATGEINGSKKISHVGGMFGTLRDSVYVENCTSTGDVYGAINVGGFAGYSAGGEVMQNCHALGKVTNNSDLTGNNRFGGFIGNLGSNTLINNCSATGSEVRAELSTLVGGFIGECSFGTNTIIKNSYTTCNVSGKSDIGGFIGYGGENTTIKNCYSTGNVQATMNYVGGFAGRSPKVTINCVAYGDVLGENSSYAGGFFGRGSGDKVENCFAYGEVEGLDNVGGFAGDCGTDTVNNCHAQQNMVVGGKYVGGFCGTLSGSFMVSNCTAEASTVGTGDYVGGFVGGNGSNILNSWASGSASTPGNYVGGFIGGQENGTSTQCYATGNASGNNNVGGFAGKGNKMEQCFATGSAIGNNYIAGFAGYGSIYTDDCFASGAVICNGNYGSGFGNRGEITNSYTSSLISGSGENIAGLVGWISSSSSSSCYFDSAYNLNLQGTANGQNLNNHKGMLTEQFVYQTNFTNWDFSSTWQIGTIATIDMYPRPYHQWYFNRNAEAIPFTSLQIKNQMSVTETGHNQNSIQIIMPFNYDITSLALEFELQEGTVLVINDSVQISGVTLNDFSRPVICYFITVANKSADSRQEDSANEAQMWMIEVENDKYQITFNYTGEGQVLGDTLQYIQKDSTTTEVLAIPASGYMFSEWVDQSGNSFSNDNLLVVSNIIGNGDYTALFELKTSTHNLELGSFRSYPLPCYNTLKVEFAKQYVGKLEIYSVSGAKVKEVNIKNTQSETIDVSGLQQGMYIIRTNNDCIKIIKQ